MNIAIIGTGGVGRALGRAIALTGRRVVFGTRDPAATAATRFAEAPVSELLDVEAAIAHARMVVLALPYGAALALAGAVPDWAQRIVVDVTNPIAAGLAGLSVGTTTSGAEEIAGCARNARVVKAFNTTGVENMRNPRYGDARVCMPVCGDDDAARQAVIDLAAALGFDALDCGELAAARYLEPFAMTWIHLALKRGLGRNFGFAVVRR